MAKPHNQYRRHTCGCLTIERDGRRMGWNIECSEAKALFRALIVSPDRNRARYPESEALRAHAEATAV